MNFNTTPRSERLHIALLGRRNVGKSSLMNALTNQDLVIVSDQKGTTTDPVYKSMELLPLGPIVLIDTPGLDDEGLLGQHRIQKTLEVLRKTDIALIVWDCKDALAELQDEFLSMIKQKNIPYLIVLNKSDQYVGNLEHLLTLYQEQLQAPIIAISAKQQNQIPALKEKMGQLATQQPQLQKRILTGLVHPNDLVILVVPIDSSAPKDRLILPQQQVLRELLDLHAKVLIVQPSELKDTLKMLCMPPDLVITDSQVFQIVAESIPSSILLTSFSILFARYKGNLSQLMTGLSALNKLDHGDHVLIAEGCTHHRQCEDIGTVKIPQWLESYTGKHLVIETVSGTSFPTTLQPYRLVIHCGGCMLNNREMQYRLHTANLQNTPILNYGILIAAVHGILNRALQPFKEEYPH